MVRQGPRLHRLPQRLDYTLIPAPLDLSLPSITEKSPLPAIIVTPSSPVHTHDFAIAFLAPPTKPSVRERVSASISNIAGSSWLGHSRSFRTTLILTLLFFIMITIHLITHQFTLHPYPKFESQFNDHTIVAYSSAVPESPNNNFPTGEHGIWGWVGLEIKKVWGVRLSVVEKERPAVSGALEDPGPLSSLQ